MKTTTKLALSSIKSGKSRSILTGIAIFLTTVLITVIAFGGHAMIRANLIQAADNYGEYYGTFNKVTPEQEKSVNLHPAFYDIGSQIYAAEAICKGYILNLNAMDSIAQMLTHFSLESGQMPKMGNEIAAQREFFTVLGYKNPQIGDTVTLSLRINGVGKITEEDFVISGFCPSSKANDLAKRYGGYVSKAFIETHIPDQTQRNTLLCFKVENNEKLGLTAMKQKINTLAEEMDISEHQISVNEKYLTWSLNPGSDVILPCVCIILIIIVVSALVIYNIFNMATVQKIREYGRLKALGANRKQLKKIIRSEGLLLSAAATPAGLLFGILIIKIWLAAFDPDIAIFSVPLLLLVTALVFSTVFLSMHKPMKLAARTSPVDAIRYEAGGKEQLRKGKESLSIFGLTLSNLALQKKRTITTILTMGLSCVLFVIIANLVGNMNPARQAREDLEYGKFRIVIDGELDDTAYPENNIFEIQKQGILGEDFIRQIAAIEGVTEVRTRKLAEIYIPDNKENPYDTIAILNEEDFAWLVRNHERGEVDYQNTTAKGGIIHMWDYFLEDDGYQIGDTFNCEFLDGDSRIPFSAPIVGSCGHSNDASWSMTEDTFEKLGIKGDMTSILFVDCTNEAEESVRDTLESLVFSSEHLAMESFSTKLDLMDFQISFIRNSCMAFLILLAIIGFMNMANTMITNILTRKREFGVMQAIGMSNRQLNRMLQLEGLVFTIGTLLVSLLVGNVLGYYAFLWCKDEGFIGMFEYHIPILENVGLILGISALQILLAFILSKNVKKESIVERVRYEG